MGVDFAANASSKAIKESVDLSAVTTSFPASYTTVGLQTVELAAGTYKLEAWGAQGGAGMNAGTAGVAGTGGYACAVVTLREKVNTIYIGVGGQGSTSTTNGTVSVGGWNGGGNAGSTGAGYRKGGGGGATHFALSKQGDGQLKNYESKKEDVLLVAGGGGGTGGYSTAMYTSSANSTATAAKGGNGGGDTGGTATGWYSSWGPSTGGSQTTGGKTSQNTWYTLSQGSFGQGGCGVLDATEHNVVVSGHAAWGPAAAGGGGGGGWFGGAGGGDFGGGGGGGSNYFNTSKVTKVTNTQGGRSGNGMAKITMLNYAPKQSSTPTFTINRHANATITFAGASGTANCLLGSDPENETITSTNIAAYKGIFMTNDTSVITSSTGAAQKADAAANAWLAYSFAADRKSMSIRATRYWTGEKTFYVRVSDTYTYNSVSETNGVWFSFNASVEGGELKKDKTLPATMQDKRAL